MTTLRFQVLILSLFLLKSFCLVAGHGVSKLLTDPDELASRVAAAIAAREMHNLGERIVATDINFG